MQQPHRSSPSQALPDLADLFGRSSLQGFASAGMTAAAAQSGGPTPAVLRRAEAYLRRHAEQPVGLGDIAAAVGCSTRTLQLTFRRFRDTTPVEAMRRVRLQLARAEIAGSTDPVTAIARRFQFSNPGRFAACYVREFGETPAATRRAARASHVIDPAP